MKILIVEDEPDVVEVIMVALTLQWADCQVLTAGDGETALELVERQSPHPAEAGDPHVQRHCFCARRRAV